MTKLINHIDKYQKHVCRQREKKLMSSKSWKLQKMRKENADQAKQNSESQIKDEIVMKHHSKGMPYST